MSYGYLNDAQKEAIRPIVSGQTVHDLGAGDLTMTKEILALGAAEVVAIDWIYTYWKRPTPDRIKLVGARFHDVKIDRHEVGFCSWPVNRHVDGFISLAMSFDTLIYLGSNVNGNMCGTKQFHEEQAGRALLAYVPNPRNSLVVTSSVRAARNPTGEERAGIANDRSSPVMLFAESEAT